MFGQQRNIFAPPRQRRQTQADHIEAMKQIFAKQAIAHARFKVLVSGGNHAHIGLDRLVPADPVKLAIRQHPQQARLQLGRHVADLVEKQGAAVGLLEASAAHRLCAGEGAAFMTEQFGLEQVFRNRRRVDRDERLVAARTMPVQRARDQFLAAARLTVDQHGGVGLRQAADGAKHFLHGRRCAENFGRHLGRLDRSRLAHRFFNRAANQLNRVVDIKGLGQVLERAALKCRDGALQIRIRGHDDDRQPRMFLFNHREQLEPRSAGHANV